MPRAALLNVERSSEKKERKEKVQREVGNESESESD